jgi:hypothetical protein
MVPGSSLSGWTIEVKSTIARRSTARNPESAIEFAPRSKAAVASGALSPTRAERAAPGVIAGYFGDAVHRRSLTEFDGDFDSIHQRRSRVIRADRFDQLVGQRRIDELAVGKLNTKLVSFEETPDCSRDFAVENGLAVKGFESFAHCFS